MFHRDSDKSKMARENKSALVSASWWVFVIIYATGVILMHRSVNELADLIKKVIGLSSFLFVSRLSAILASVGILFILGRSLSRNSTGLKKLLLFIPLMVIADLSLVAVPIERIHYVEYGFLTWIAYKAGGKPYLAALLSFSFGVLDEAYQYWVLYADRLDVYFDWNDMGLNLIGVLAVLFFFLPDMRWEGKVSQRAVFVSIVIWIATATLLVFLLNPDQYFMRDDPYKGSSSFWIESGINTHYHIMNAWEGLLSLGGILILVTGYYRPKRSRDLTP
jgi:hypothetical protein